VASTGTRKVKTEAEADVVLVVLMWANRCGKALQEFC
jgi:hypothetical protein